MDYLNLSEALECVKSGETVYRPFDNEDGYFTQDWLVKEIIYYYFNDYKYGHIDSDLYGWIDAITEYVGLYEEEYKKWYEEYGEDDDVKDKMDEYFTYEYVNDYVEKTIYIDYEIVQEDDFPEEDEDKDEDKDEECDEEGEEYEDSSLFYRNYLNSLK